MCVCFCAFQPVIPPDKLFTYKHMEFPLFSIASSQVVEQVSVSGEGQVFFEGHFDLIKALVDFISA